LSKIAQLPITHQNQFELLSVIPLLPSGTVCHKNLHQTLIQWNSTHSNASLRCISSRNISICICNAQSLASVCDSISSTYDTLKTVYYYY